MISTFRTQLKQLPRTMSTLSSSRLVIEKSPSARSCPPVNQLVFGKTFTNHMLTVPWTQAGGWGTPKIEAYRPFTLEPSAVVFHYAPSLFEGLKAYRNPRGDILLFRPNKNMERMNGSAHRLALPTFEGDELIKMIKKLIEVDQDWVPSEPGYSLYIRPTLMGTQPSLGVGAPEEALLFVILSPVGPYYSSVVKPVALEANPDRVRAWPGGSGDSKIGANYAPCVLPQLEAASRGYQQNLWLYGAEHWLTEVGTMNLFIVLRTDDGLEVVTPPLNGMILPGVTRDSLLELLRAHESGASKLPLPSNIRVSEREINMGEIVAAADTGRLAEVFGAGTAVVVSPVDRIGYLGKDVHVPVGESGFGQVAEVLLNKLKAIQWGHEEHPWTTRITE